MRLEVMYIWGAAAFSLSLRCCAGLSSSSSSFSAWRVGGRMSRVVAPLNPLPPSQQSLHQPTLSAFPLTPLRQAGPHITLTGITTYSIWTLKTAKPIRKMLFLLLKCYFWILKTPVAIRKRSLLLKFCFWTLQTTTAMKKMLSLLFNCHFALIWSLQNFPETNIFLYTTSGIIYNNGILIESRF